MFHDLKTEIQEPMHAKLNGKNVVINQNNKYDRIAIRC